MDTDGPCSLSQTQIIVCFWKFFFGGLWGPMKRGCFNEAERVKRVQKIPKWSGVGLKIQKWSVIGLKIQNWSGIGLKIQNWSGIGLRIQKWFGTASRIPKWSGRIRFNVWQDWQMASGGHHQTDVCLNTERIIWWGESHNDPASNNSRGSDDNCP